MESAHVSYSKPQPEKTTIYLRKENETLPLEKVTTVVAYLSLTRLHSPLSNIFGVNIFRDNHRTSTTRNCTERLRLFHVRRVQVSQGISSYILDSLVPGIQQSVILSLPREDTT
ncbi:hypothetical protein J6590_030071 [Homalodisca vitripennis]|nr:hypothetical protein J6590_030071 [Homalodisca vitripennis]